MTRSFVALRSSYAWTWLIAGIAAQTVLWWRASRDWHPTPDVVWSTRPWLILLSMFLLLAAAVVMHALDERFEGWGFRHVYRHGNNGSYEQDDQKYVPSVLTVESVRVAMTAGILAAILSDWKRHFPDPLPSPFPFSGIYGRPQTLFFSLILVALASSIVTTMAALLCYEYSSRFAWKDPWPKVELLKKALELGRFGFYCLMWSLAVVPVLLDYRLVFVSILFVFVIMWCYYFFPVPSPAASQPPAGGGHPADDSTTHSEPDKGRAQNDAGTA